jgi:hypothetical protein
MDGRYSRYVFLVQRVITSFELGVDGGHGWGMAELRVGD